MRTACILLFSVAFNLIAGEKTEYVVALDGSGDYRTIQNALDAVPMKHGNTITIRIRKGIYPEKIFITKSNICV